MTAFDEFGVLAEISKAVDEMEWTLPTDIQAEAIPLILGGGDVLMAAEAGSGKTGAFCLPILQMVWETLKDISEGKASKVLQQTFGKWTMSFFDREAAFVVTPDGLRCQLREFKEWHGCRASKGVFGKGAYYYEVTVTDEGLCRVGWSTQQARLKLGTDRFGYGFGGTGKKSNDYQFDDYGEAFGINDTIGCLLNLDNGEVRFTKNGQDLGVAFTLNSNQKQACYFPAVVLKNTEVFFNFGASPFKYTMPTGYVAVSSAPAKFSKSNTVTGASSATSSKLTNNSPKAIIIEPSRVLAEQTFNQIIKFKKYLDVPKVRELLVIGGVNVKDQISVLNSGVDIVVGTPGRMEVLIEGGYLSLTQCRFFVLDEANGLLRDGYGKMIKTLHNQIPKITSNGTRLQMVVCSSTRHDFKVKKMAKKLMHSPTWVELKGEDAVPETVHHCVVNVDPQTDRSWERLQSHIQTDAVHACDNVQGNTAEALSEAVKILKGEYCIRAIREHKMDRALIFCRTKVDCDNLERYFSQSGNDLSCACLYKDRKTQVRRDSLEKFKAGTVKFLICTDIALGIDIPGLPFIINVTLPDQKYNYVHRISRVGRAGRMGLAISLVATVPEKYIGEIERHLNVTIQRIETDMKVPYNDFYEKVVYGEKKLNTGSGYKDHVSEMAPAVKLLSELESHTQICYLKMHHNLEM